MPRLSLVAVMVLLVATLAVFTTAATWQYQDADNEYFATAPTTVCDWTGTGTVQTIPYTVVCVDETQSPVVPAPDACTDPEPSAPVCPYTALNVPATVKWMCMGETTYEECATLSNTCQDATGCTPGEPLAAVEPACVDPTDNTAYPSAVGPDSPCAQGTQPTVTCSENCPQLQHFFSYNGQLYNTTAEFAALACDTTCATPETDKIVTKDLTANISVKCIDVANGNVETTGCGADPAITSPACPADNTPCDASWKCKKEDNTYGDCAALTDAELCDTSACPTSPPTTRAITPVCASADAEFTGAVDIAAGCSDASTPTVPSCPLTACPGAAADYQYRYKHDNQVYTNATALLDANPACDTTCAAPETDKIIQGLDKALVSIVCVDVNNNNTESQNPTTDCQGATALTPVQDVEEFTCAAVDVPCNAAWMCKKAEGVYIPCEDLAQADVCNTSGCPTTAPTNVTFTPVCATAAAEHATGADVAVGCLDTATPTVPVCTLTECPMAPTNGTWAYQAQNQTFANATALTDANAQCDLTCANPEADKVAQAVITIVCVDEAGDVVADTLCDDATKPEEVSAVAAFTCAEVNTPCNVAWMCKKAEGVYIPCADLTDAEVCDASECPTTAPTTIAFTPVCASPTTPYANFTALNCTEDIKPTTTPQCTLTECPAAPAWSYKYSFNGTLFPNVTDILEVFPACDATCAAIEDKILQRDFTNATIVCVDATGVVSQNATLDCADAPQLLDLSDEAYADLVNCPAVNAPCSVAFLCQDSAGDFVPCADLEQEDVCQAANQCTDVDTTRPMANVTAVCVDAATKTEYDVAVGFANCTAAHKDAADAAITQLSCTLPCTNKWLWKDAAGNFTEQVDVDELCDWATCTANGQNATANVGAYTLTCVDTANSTAPVELTEAECEKLTKPEAPVCECEATWLCQPYNNSTLPFSAETCQDPQAFYCNKDQCEDVTPVATWNETKKCVYNGVESLDATDCAAFVYPGTCACTPQWKCSLESTWNNTSAQNVDCAAECSALQKDHFNTFATCATPSVTVHRFCVRTDGTQAEDVAECEDVAPAEKACDTLCQMRCAVLEDDVAAPDLDADTIANFTSTKCAFDAAYCETFGLQNCDAALPVKALCFIATSFDDDAPVYTEVQDQYATSACGPQTLTPYTCDPGCQASIYGLQFTEAGANVDALYFQHSNPTLAFNYTGPADATIQVVLKNNGDAAFSRDLLSTPIAVSGTVDSFTVEEFTEAIPFETILAQQLIDTAPNTYFLQVEIALTATNATVAAPSSTAMFSIDTYCAYQNSLGADVCSGRAGASCGAKDNACYCPGFPAFYETTRDCSCPELDDQAGDACVFETECNGVADACAPHGFVDECTPQGNATCACLGEWTKSPGSEKCDQCALSCGTGTPNDGCTACSCKAGTVGADCSVTTTIAVGLVFKQVPAHFNNSQVRAKWQYDLITAITAISKLNRTQIAITNVTLPAATPAPAAFLVLADDGKLKVNLNIAAQDGLTKETAGAAWALVTADALNQYPVAQEAGGVAFVTEPCSGVECTDAEYAGSNEEPGKKEGKDDEYNIIVIVVVVVLAVIAIIAIISVVCFVSRSSSGKSSSSGSAASNDYANDASLELQ